jgi:NADPH-dependent glutamate synthase beta subunit-like oxidoreductase
MNHEWIARGKYRVRVPDLDYYRRTIKCQAGCPVGTNAREYVIAIAEEDYERAYLIARQCNPFASVCGRVCNALCEVECRRGDFDAAIAIRALKRFVAERHGVEAGRYSAAVTASLLEQAAGDSTTVHDMRALGRLRARQGGNGRRKGQAAVIGSGPAGLSAAHDLALMGHRVTVFEASDVPGGMLRLGIPPYRLPYDLLEAEIQVILDLGVELRLNTPLGPDGSTELAKVLTLADLRKQGYEAIFIAVGAHRSLDLHIEGAELDGVLRATDFLLNVNRGYRVDLGNRVVVVGGGNVALDAARTALRQADAAVKPEEVHLALDVARSALRQVMEGDQEAEDTITAMDAARSAMRLGATEVSILYRRSRAEMPASDEEVTEAEHEGARFRYLTSPVRILGNPRLTAVECVRMELGPPDESGRRRPLPIPGSEFVIEADSVIMAIGQTPNLSFLGEEDDVQLTRQGNIAIDPETMATTAPGVFAGGDVAAAGPRIIIQAVADGLRAARAIDDYLQGQRSQVQARGTMTVIEPYSMPPNYQKIPRRPPPTLPLERRVGIAEVELVYPEAQAREQASRCLRCHIQTVFDGDKCILCGGCVDVCPELCLKMVPLRHLENTPDLESLVVARFERPLSGFPHDLGTAMIKDEMRCIRCGLCAKRCPTDAITMEALSFVEEYV